MLCNDQALNMLLYVCKQGRRRSLDQACVLSRSTSGFSKGHVKKTEISSLYPLVISKLVTCTSACVTPYVMLGANSDVQLTSPRWLQKM